MKTVLAIPGSTRMHSTHKNVIRYAASLADGKFEIDLFDGTAELPHFNPDLDGDAPPKTVIDFRRRIQNADGVLICTPEYAMGVPGTLKNALDWTVSSADLYRKPVALITASSQGYKGHAALMETLTILGSALTEEMQMIIPFIKKNVAADGTVTDPASAEAMHRLVHALWESLS
jgi:NAD(P)H-dependent FMN reductase